jgi:hypothetical protein
MRSGWIALLAVTAACSRTPAPQVDSDAPPADVAVQIVNHGWSDMVILVSTGGAWERLGHAGAVKSTNFFVPWRKLAGAGVVLLQADPTDGSRALISERLSVQPGKLVVWTLEHQLDQSTIAVY